MLLNKTMELYRSTIMSWVEDPGMDEFQGLDMTSLSMDEAYVVPSSSVGDLGLYSVSDDCYRCPLTLEHTLRQNASESWVISTVHPAAWRLMQSSEEQFLSTKNKSGLVCELRPELGEFGVYTLNISTAGCEFTTAKQPVNIYMPLVLAVITLCGAWVCCAAFCLARKYWHKKGKLRYGEDEVLAKQRLKSIDTFRGLTIVSMIFINSGAGGYTRWIDHVTWNGLNFADLVAPCFVWIMGVCIPLSIKGVFNRGVPRWKALLHIFKRSFILFALGVSLNSVGGGNFLGSLRIMGVLQRLGLSYFVAASCYLLTTTKYFTHPRGACGQALRDVWAVVWCWLLAAVALTIHTYVTWRIHDPQCPAGYLGPGGRHNNWAVNATCVGGAAGYVDRLLLTADRVYQHTMRIYASERFDPENILGTLTTIVHTIIGIQAGATLLHYKSHQARVARWLAWAIVLALVGASLAGFSRERGIIPINKKLWSISFVLVLSAVSGGLLSVCYVLTDVWRVWGGAPFRAPGRNAIFLYAAHHVGYQLFPFVWRVHRARTHGMLLVQHLWATALWVIVAHVMAKKKIFITI